MSFEDRLRDSLRSRAERAEASADAYDRIVQRVEPRSPRAWLAPAVAVGGVAAAVVLVVALVTEGDGDVDVVAGPDSIPVADVRPIWPVADPAGFETMQRRVDSGDEQWLLDAQQVARKYLEAHEMAADVGPRRLDGRDDLEGYPEGVVIGHRVGWIELARAERDDGAMWFVVGAHDSRLPMVDAKRRGARVDVEFTVIMADVVVTARAGSVARAWIAESTVDLREGRSQRLVLDVGRRAPDRLLVQIRTTDAGELVGLTELLVEGEFSP